MEKAGRGLPVPAFFMPFLKPAGNRQPVPAGVVARDYSSVGATGSRAEARLLRNAQLLFTSRWDWASNASA